MRLFVLLAALAIDGAPPDCAGGPPRRGLRAFWDDRAPEAFWGAERAEELLAQGAVPRRGGAGLDSRAPPLEGEAAARHPPDAQQAAQPRGCRLPRREEQLPAEVGLRRHPRLEPLELGLERAALGLDAARRGVRRRLAVLRLAAARDRLGARRRLGRRRARRRLISSLTRQPPLSPDGGSENGFFLFLGQNILS